MSTGLVIAAHGRRGLLEDPDGSVRPYLVASRQLQVVCGDQVCWQIPPGADAAVVERILERRNMLRRQRPGGGETELLAANLSHLAVVIAPVPEPDYFLIDRYLCAAELMAASAAVVVNKCDLGRGDAAEIAGYRALGYAVIETSTLSGSGMEALLSWLGTGIGILVGQSGVGKSSLLNRLVPAAGLAVGQVSVGSGLGRHTTTASIMHRLASGGRLIDTPGVRGFIPDTGEARRVQLGFREILQLAGGCRFADCSHQREPGCAVLAALAEGRISARRHASYRRILLDAEQTSLDRNR